MKVQFASLLLLLPTVATAQLTVHRTGAAVAAPVHANAAGESISISISVTSLNFTLKPHSASASVTVPFSVTYSFTQTRNVSIYAYFASASAALTGGSPAVNIPSSSVFSTTLTSSALVAFTGSSPFSGNTAVTLLNSYPASGSATSTASYKVLIDCTNLPQLPAATYSGVLYMQAQAL